MSDLDVLYPQGKEVMVSGEVLVIKPFAFGMLPKVSKHLSPILKNLSASGLIGFLYGDNGEATMRVAADWPLRILDIMSDGGEDLVTLTALLVNKPREWMDTIPLDEGVALITTLIEVNADLFAKKVLPMIQREKATSAGATSSVSSSQEVMRKTTSPATP